MLSYQLLWIHFWPRRRKPTSEKLTKLSYWSKEKFGKWHVKAWIYIFQFWSILCQNFFLVSQLDALDSLLYENISNSFLRKCEVSSLWLSTAVQSSTSTQTMWILCRYAPESIEYEKFSFQSDVWSYGVTLFEMFSYGAEPNLPNVSSKAKEMAEALKNNIRLPIPANCSHYIYTRIMVPCWQLNSAERPSFRDLCILIEDMLNMQHSWKYFLCSVYNRSSWTMSFLAVQRRNPFLTFCQGSEVFTVLHVYKNYDSLLGLPRSRV